MVERMVLAHYSESLPFLRSTVLGLEIGLVGLGPEFGFGLQLVGLGSVGLWLVWLGLGLGLVYLRNSTLRSKV